MFVDSAADLHPDHKLEDDVSVPTPSLDAISAGLVHLVRGDKGWRVSAELFLDSYRRHTAGVAHRSIVVIKGFESDDERDTARALFAGEGFDILERDDAGLDIGAYIGAARTLPFDQLVFLNSHTEILSDYWLYKLLVHLLDKRMGVVSATGSFESLRSLGTEFAEFPNPHVRSNAFAVRREQFLRLVGEFSVATKIDAYRFESGRTGLTRRMMDDGCEVAIVGRNGRAYEPQWWPSSDTFRQGRQDNLLVGDNVTRTYGSSTWTEKHHLATISWGRYLQEEHQLSWENPVAGASAKR